MGKALGPRSDSAGSNPSSGRFFSGKKNTSTEVLVSVLAIHSTHNSVIILYSIIFAMQYHVCYALSCMLYNILYAHAIHVPISCMRMLYQYPVRACYAIMYAIQCYVCTCIHYIGKYRLKNAKKDTQEC